MQVKCSISGLTFKAQHFPGYVPAGKTAHPLFYLEQRELYRIYYDKWLNNALTPLDSYLLFLALAYSSDHVEFLSPMEPTPDNVRMANQMIPRMAEALIRVNQITTPRFKIPSYRVTDETRSVKGLNKLLEAWEAAITEFDTGLAYIQKQKSLAEQESKLDKYLRDYNKPVGFYQKRLAIWADTCAPFPEGKRAVYYKVIAACVKEAKSVAIGPDVIQEVYEYITENILPGSSYYHALTDLLSQGVKYAKEYYGIGVKTYDLMFNLPDIDSSTQSSAALSAEIPKEQPKKEDYDTAAKYLAAKMRWNAAQRANNARGNK